MAPRYWIALHPDLTKPIGGVKQVHRLAEALTRCGREVRLIQQHQNFHPGWFQSDVKTIGLNAWKAHLPELDRRHDVVIIPETFVPAFVRYAPGLPKIIFNQNGAYSFGLPKQSSGMSVDQILDMYGHPELLHVLCVSKHDEQLIVKGFGLGSQRVSRVLNGIETDLFHPRGSKKRQIAYMPRKNGPDAQVVAALLKQQPWFDGWSLQPIDRCTQAQVAHHLQRSLIFLAFGHPEGFGLPLAEALACGCALVGYSGLGGRELFAIADAHGVGCEVPYGDWYGFVDGCARLQAAIKREQSQFLASLLAVSKDVRQRYCSESMHSSIALALARWESSLDALN